MVRKKGTNILFAEHIVPVLPGTQEMENLLQPAYQMTVEQAEELIKQRQENAQNVPWDEYQKAIAFMAAYHSKAEATSTDPGWQRKPTRADILAQRARRR